MSRILSALAFSTLVACGGGSASTRAPAAPAQPTASTDPSCPVEVSGTAVTVEDTANGAALVFVTTGDVAELRKRVAALAQMHNEHHGGMGPLPTGNETGGGGDHSGHAGDHGAHAGHGGAGGHDAHAGHGAPAGGAHAGHMGGMIGVHSKATAEDVDGGAKLVIVAFPDGVAKLQSELRMHAQHLANGTCKMDHAPMDHSQTPAKASAPTDHSGHH